MAGLVFIGQQPSMFYIHVGHDHKNIDALLRDRQRQAQVSSPGEARLYSVSGPQRSYFFGPMFLHRLICALFSSAMDQHDNPTGRTAVSAPTHSAPTCNVFNQLKPLPSGSHMRRMQTYYSVRTTACTTPVLRTHTISFTQLHGSSTNQVTPWPALALYSVKYGYVRPLVFRLMWSWTQ
jgi:hypothetical protein